MRLVHALVALALTATTAAAATSTIDSVPPAPVPCTHPYPCGDEWPDGLVGPFDLAGVQHVFVEMSDGVLIEGWVGLPELPDGVRAPTIVSASPYHYACWTNPLASGPYCSGGPGDAGWWTDPPATGPPGFEYEAPVLDLGIAPRRLVAHGFAVANFAVRGTANSGGCLSLGGQREQLDQAELVEWVALQPWSNARVAFGGLSYGAATATQAAVAAPEALKTVVMTGLVNDWYTSMATPQGAVQIFYSLLTGPYYSEISLYPDPFHPERIQARIDPETQRLCPGLIEANSATTTPLLGVDRDQAFFDERRLLDQLADVQAAALILHGFQDARVSWEEDLAWQALAQAPKHMVEGQWIHQWPTESHSAMLVEGGLLEAMPAPPPRWGHGFEQLLFDWYDYWLKGVGPTPDGLNTVDYQDDAGTWRRTDAWPPAEARAEALYLNSDDLAATGTPGVRSYSTWPDPVQMSRGLSGAENDIPALDAPEYGVWAALCPEDPPEGSQPAGIAWMTEPLEEAVVIAGNPFAWLEIMSDQPAGLLDIRFVDVGPDLTCDAFGRAFGWTELAAGYADIRYHAGNFVGSDFPTLTPTHVRVDLDSIAARVEPGHRLALVASVGEGPFGDHQASPPAAFATFTVVASDSADGSHVVVPVVVGSLSPTLDPGVATPRPFGPPSVTAQPPVDGATPRATGPKGPLPATGDGSVLAAVLLVGAAALARRKVADHRR